MSVIRWNLQPEEFEWLQEFVTSPGYTGLKKLINAQIEWHKEKLCTVDLKDDRMLLIERSSLEGAKRIQRFVDNLKAELKVSQKDT